ncbi:MAG: alanine--glyoxylate aminotransferase family protein, partial [Clostridia bacterium]|nr:alanine--glyoxylate aminotransferase family protein [Clostridia bacterium]
DICAIHQIPFTPINCEYGKTLKQEQLLQYENKGYTAFLVNLGETSTGVLYDIELISEFCKKNNLFLIVDCISSFLCDDLNMQKHSVNVALTGSQKALALAPGLSVICLDGKAQKRLLNINPQSLYFDLKSYLINGERGQTPFTPAVGVILQLNKRLKLIKDSGGIKAELERHRELAQYFRAKIKKLPLNIFADYPSDAVTSLSLRNADKSAYKVFEVLKDEYGIFVCPNGGDLKEKVFRVGHMGELSYSDYDRLICALEELEKKRII